METTYIIILFLIVFTALIIYLYYKREYKKSETLRDSLEKKSTEIERLRERLEIELDSTRKTQELLRKETTILDTQSKFVKDEFNRLEIEKIDLRNSISNLKDKAENLNSKEKALGDKLYEISNLSKDQAKDLIITNLREELKQWKDSEIKKEYYNLLKEKESLSQSILLDAMLQASSNSYYNITTSRFSLPTEDLKGKIIGKEGRNKEALEKHTGVELILDPKLAAFSLSSFDPIRREIASIAISRLLKDGRIHPGTIEETVKKVKEDFSKLILKRGLEFAEKFGLNDLPEEIITLLGKYRYRFSYGQNLEKHTEEVIYIGREIAKQLNLDIHVVTLACLMHDIGKVVITDSLGTEQREHHHISADLARKYSMGEKVANAIEAHHDDIESKYPEAEVVKIADRVSASRSGARRDISEEYIKRITELENLAKSRFGIEDVFALYAGRELRIIVNPQNYTEKSAEALSYEISREIRKIKDIPGAIKVTVIRETRQTQVIH